MDNISDILEKRLQIKKIGPRHQLSASVDEIVSVVGITPKYGYKYWLGLVKRSGKGYGDILAIVKEVRLMPDKYSKGGRITNILRTKKNGSNISNKKKNP